MRLTVRSVETARASNARREIPDSLLPGLYLVISHLTGAKSWCVRYRFRGVSRKFTIGSFPQIDLKTARALGAKALRQVAEGRDPGREKIEARSARVDSADSVAAEFIERHVRRSNRQRSAKGTEGLLRHHVLPYWHGRPIGEVTRRDILDVLDRVVDAGTPIAANRTLAAIRKMFRWAVERDIIATSPCINIKPPAAERSRDRTLSDEELRQVWQAADKIGYPFGSVTKMLALTGQRRDEVSRMTWEEVDLKKRVWRLPAARTKNGRPHEVPLSTTAISILKAAPRLVSSPYVFTTNGATPASGFAKNKKRLDGLLPADMPPWRLHDLRRTVASGLARLGVGLPVVEKILNHTSGTFKGVLAVYQKYDFRSEREKALQLWGQHVDALVSAQPDKAQPLRGAHHG